MRGMPTANLHLSTAPSLKTTGPRPLRARRGLVAPGEAKPTIAPHLDEPNLGITFEYMRFLNQHTTDYIRMADAKAAILVTLLSANLLVLVQRAADAIARLHNPGTIFVIVNRITIAEKQIDDSAK